jgi:hypothetical protein
MTTICIQPPKYPEINPKAMPIVAAKETTIKPTINEVRAP